MKNSENWEDLEQQKRGGNPGTSLPTQGNSAGWKTITVLFSVLLFCGALVGAVTYFVWFGSDDSTTASETPATASNEVAQVVDDAPEPAGPSSDTESAEIDWPGDPATPEGSPKKRRSQVLQNGTLLISGSVPSKTVENNIIQAATSRLGGNASAVASELEWHPDSSPNVEEGLVFIENAVNFGKGESEILADADLTTLNLAVRILTENPTVFVVIIGHTDDGGESDLNARLADERAGAVVGYMIEQGVIPSQIVVAAAGEDAPIASNATEEGRQKNRRVELQFKNFLG